VTVRPLAASAMGLTLLACAAPLPRPKGEVIQGLLPSSVQVTAERRGAKIRVASGVVIHAAARPDRSLVLTTRHTTRGLDDVELYVAAKGHARRRASVVAVSPDADLALLQVDGVVLPPVTLGAESRLGDDVWVVAYPWGRRLTLVGGVISQVEAGADGDGALGATVLIDASVSYGASGGGVFDAATGQLVGVVEGYQTARVQVPGDPRLAVDFPVPGETKVVPARLIRRFLEQAGYASLRGP